MIKIDRMEIDDAGAEPKKLAKAILKQLPADTLKVPIRDIAKAIDIYEIREEELEGLEGALIVPPDKSVGAILIKRGRHEFRERFTIAHEIGHYVHPYHRANSHDGFICKERDFRADNSVSQDAHTRMEAQANEFAAELLMPAQAVADFIRSKACADLNHIIELANRHCVSREAAARRYISCIGDAVAVVFSSNGIIRYTRSSEFFPRLSVSRRDPVPKGSASALSNADIGEVTDCIEADALHWLESDQRVNLFEQTLAQKNGFRMTLLTAEIEEPEEDWEPPRFHRRR